MCDHTNDEPAKALEEFTDMVTTAEIVAGWERVSREYTPRPLTTLERHQMERAELVERQAAETPFVLGEPIHG